MFKNSNRGVSTLIVIGIIAVLVVVVGGGIFGYQYISSQKNNKQSENQQQNQNTNQNQTQNASELTITQTAGWKTYTDQKNRFSIKYPADWHNFIDAKNDDVIFCPSDDENCDINAVYVYVYTKGGSEEILNNWRQQGSSLKESNITINGLTAVKRQESYCMGTPLLTNGVFIKGNDYDFQIQGPISICGVDKNKMQNSYSTSESIFNNMLSTFKFSKPINLNDYWKKYDNENLGVSLEYPMGWSVKQTNYNPLTIKIYSADDSSQIYISNIDSSADAKYAIDKTGKGGFLLANWQYDSNNKNYIKRVVSVSLDGTKYTSISLIVKNDLAKGEMDSIVDTINFQNSFLHTRKEINGGINNGLLSINANTSNWLTYNYDGISFKYPATLDKKSNWSNGVYLFSGAESPSGISVLEFSNSADLSLEINSDSELLLRDVTLTKTKITINGLAGEIIDRKTDVGNSRLFSFQIYGKYMLFKSDFDFMNLDVVNAIYNSINKI